MEPNDHQQHHQVHPHHHFASYFNTSTATTTAATAGGAAAASPTNGILPPNNTNNDGGGGAGAAHVVFPHSVGPSSAAVTTALMEPPRRKRGRPRKYGTPEQALAAKKSASSSSNSAAREKREAAAASGGVASSPSYSGSSRKSQQMAALGNVGQGFTPHVISVAPGEDVGQKIMVFMQQSKRDLCILSASGSISSASLRQPATSGGNIAYEGRFEIISLSGSYVRTELGGRTGGLSICLSNTDGQIVGGGVGGPLKAAGPVQVIVGTFLMDKKDRNAGAKGDATTDKLPSPVGGASISNLGFRVESSVRNPAGGNDDHQTFGGNPFMFQPRGLHIRPTDWVAGPGARISVGYDLTGRPDHGAGQSPENGDYD